MRTHSPQTMHKQLQTRRDALHAKFDGKVAALKEQHEQKLAALNPMRLEIEKLDASIAAIAPLCEPIAPTTEPAAVERPSPDFSGTDSSPPQEQAAKRKLFGKPSDDERALLGEV